MMEENLIHYGIILFCIGGNWYNAIKRQQNNEKDKFFRESRGQV